ncbi:hypothetical protein TNCT_246351 [Trichonephila clavata]|uniref:Neurotransmitter-gated ion-channel ligand-binding domain-containing protein n=1 Tax=Trichonephila clavata TaxID=2740835 RepID=A0A8X6IWX1_TRICU|nr:hypothetical protein TNCT_246351 [Trichonephila clavata]
MEGNFSSRKIPDTNLAFCVCVWIKFLLLLCTQDLVVSLQGQYCDGLIPDDYKKYDAPSKKGETVPVYIKLVIVDIDEISEGNMDFRLHMYLVSSWNDTRLNSSAFSTYNDQCSNHFWVPDIIFERAKPSPSFSTFNINFKINEDGSFTRAERLSDSSCIDYKSVLTKFLETEG